ncbi:hypothetical protein [Nocardioides sp.]|uniref:hypothetical protein n=1 Tax=Nocardioides sp. TaxID=35761 RepID=UPI003511892D
MPSPRSTAETLVRDFLTRINKDASADLDAPLYADGVGLDSLETAELSALLEDELGNDPFSTADVLPQTLREVLDHYGADDAAAETA